MSEQDGRLDEDVPAGNRFEFRFEASGVVGKGTADAVPGESTEDDS